MRSLIPIIILSLVLAVAPVLAQPYGTYPGIATPYQYELTNPKCTDRSTLTAIPVSLGASGATTACYYSPEVPIAPGVTTGFLNVKCTDASANPTLTIFILYSASATNTTTPTDQTSGSYTTSFSVSGASPFLTCTPIKLMPNARTIRIGFKNNDSHVATLNYAPVNL